MIILFNFVILKFSRLLLLCYIPWNLVKCRKHHRVNIKHSIFLKRCHSVSVEKMIGNGINICATPSNFTFVYISIIIGKTNLFLFQKFTFTNYKYKIGDKWILTLLIRIFKKLLLLKFVHRYEFFKVSFKLKNVQ